jgi:hypothetical protein
VECPTVMENYHKLAKRLWKGTGTSVASPSKIRTREHASGRMASSTTVKCLNDFRMEQAPWCGKTANHMKVSGREASSMVMVLTSLNQKNNPLVTQCRLMEASKSRPSGLKVLPRKLHCSPKKPQWKILKQVSMKMPQWIYWRVRSEKSFTLIMLWRHSIRTSFVKLCLLELMKPTWLWL